GGIHAWLELVRISDKVPLLEYTEPEDKIGEEADWFVWTVEEGGVSNPLLAEQIEFLQGRLDRYKKYVQGETRLKETPDSIYQRIPQETRRQQLEKVQEAARKLLDLLAPQREAVHKLLEDLGIDPVTYQPIK